MLVLVPGEIVDTIHVSPVNVGGKVIIELPSVRGGLERVLEDGVLNSAATGGGGISLVDEVVGGVRVLRLRESVDGLVVSWIVQLVIGGDVPFWLGPGVLGDSPGAVALNGDVVGTTADTEETILTPVGSPGVSDEPVLVAILDTIADNGDIVDNLQVTSVITEDATIIGLKSLRDGDTTSERTSLVDFLHHVLFASDLTILFNAVGVVLGRNVAGLTWVAVTAHSHSGAAETVVVTTGLIGGAGLIGDVVLVDPLEGVEGITTVATIIRSLTGDEDLRGDVDLGPGTISSDLDSITEGGGGSLGPA